MGSVVFGVSMSMGLLVVLPLLGLLFWMGAVHTTGGAGVAAAAASTAAAGPSAAGTAGFSAAVCPSAADTAGFPAAVGGLQLGFCLGSSAAAGQATVGRPSHKF
jgi:hypothetical protein